MKKLLLTLILLIPVAVIISAQADHEINLTDVAPVTGIPITISEVPQAVLKTFHTDFKHPGRTKWYRFPYPLKEYGWAYNRDASNIKPDQYQVAMDMGNGYDWFAVYAVDGELLATRDEYNNGVIPAFVKEAFENSIYKDWTVVGNTEIINYYYDKNNFDKHFCLTVEKDNVRRVISFNYKTTNTVKK